MSAALSLVDVCAGYGPFRSLFDVTFDVPTGGVTALLGPNGAGKTSVARVASGLVAPTSGRVLVDGVDLTGAPSWRYARAGVAHAVEGRSVFASLTVEENLVLGFGGSRRKPSTGAALDRAYAAFPRLGERRSQRAGTLSGGEQRMLSLARVLATPPKLLVADELSLGLAPVLIDALYDALAAIRDAGTTLLIVEQQVQRAVEIADTVVILGHGQVRHAGPADDLEALRVQLSL